MLHIYLTHNLVLTKATALFRPLARSASPSLALVWALSLGIAGIVFAVGLVYYILIERPCMERDWPQKLAFRLKLRRPAAAS